MSAASRLLTMLEWTRRSPTPAVVRAEALDGNASAHRSWIPSPHDFATRLASE